VVPPRPARAIVAQAVHILCTWRCRQVEVEKAGDPDIKEVVTTCHTVYVISLKIVVLSLPVASTLVCASVRWGECCLPLFHAEWR